MTNLVIVRRELVLAAVTEDWEPAEDIAERAGVSLQSASKLLDSLAREGKVARDFDQWLDQRHRKRSRSLYKVKVNIDWIATFPAWMTGGVPRA